MLLSPSCWASGGVPNKSPTNCGYGSLINRNVTCVPESIYQAIYDPRIDLTRPAKRRRRRCRRRVQGLERRGRLTGMTMIAERPAEATDRYRSGIGRVTASWVPEIVRR